MKNILNYAIGILIASIPLTSYAFKIDTHVWVGQQVINDLEDDGKLSIQLGEETVNIDVRDDVKNTILANKSAYLMGNIGPDAAPDVVVGQTTVHPGVKDAEGVNIGWQTNTWLEYLLRVSEGSDVGTAYTYGYLGHAAADVFAHTYVNQYAGDIFNLTDETLVEQRHFVLESFIGKYTPLLKNHLGSNLGSPGDLVTMNDELAEFIRDNLIYNDEVVDEYLKVPTAYHLAAYAKFREGINDIAEDGIWHDIDIAVTIIVAAYFDIELTPDEAEQVVDAAQSVLDELNGASEDVQQLANNMYENASQFEETVFSSLVVAKETMAEVEQEWMSKHQEWRRKLLDVENLPSCLKIYVCKPDPKILNPGHMDCGWKRDAVCELAKDLVQASNDLILDSAELLENETLGLKNDLIQATVDLRDETVKAVESVHAIQNGFTDFLQVMSADASPIQSVLSGWRSDVDIALTEYVKAANTAMINTMDPTKSSLEPLEKWFECYHGSIVGIPSSISNCGQLLDSIGDLFDSIENILMIMDEVATMGSPVPGAADLIVLKDKLIEDLLDEIKEEIGEAIEDLIPEEIQEIIVLLGEDVDEAVLNQYFTTAESINPAKGLIMIPDIAERVKAEMSLTSEDTFDPQKYAVAYNAVVLAKLALLDNYGYEQLALLSGSSDYLDYFFEVDNLVAQAFGNIDGNHQWMPLPPPIPNSFGNYSTVDYTYSSDRSALGEETNDLGFIPWKGDMRDKLFRKIFIGPLSPGIDAPSVISKAGIVEQSYPYQPCSANPYPNDVEDRTCIAIILIPILSLLLN